MIFRRLLIFFVFIFLLFARPVLAQDKVNLYFFWSQGCPHCAREKVFLEKLEAENPKLNILDFDIGASAENRRLMEEVGKKLNIDVYGVPFTVVGEHTFVGYYDDQTTGREIQQAVGCALDNGCTDPVKNLVAPSTPTQDQKNQDIPEYIILPLFGQVETKNLSLPALTFIIALLDGFNPCAMWVLLFLISLLLGMKDKKRMWILGSTFIVASSLVYFLFMSAWLNLFLFLGLVVWVRFLIGLVALGAGSYNLRDYFVNRQGGCRVVGEEKRKAIFDRLKKITALKNFWLALGGMVVLAFFVNLIELVCSAGLPAIYTRILTLTNLPTWQYYGYLLFYILVFMADDLFIFFTAMLTLQAVGIESKYSRASKLIGGTLMLIIGLLLIFKPGLLMFG